MAINIRSSSADGHSKSSPGRPDMLHNTAPPLSFQRAQPLRLPRTQQSIIIKSGLINGIPTELSHREKRILHWRMAFKVQRAKGGKEWFITVSPLLDRRLQEESGTKAIPITVSFEYKSYGHSENALNRTKFESAFKDKDSEAITFDMLINLIKEERLNRYRSDEKGFSCFHWVKMLLEAIIRKGWFRSQKEAEDIMSKLDALAKEKIIDNEYIIPGGKCTSF